MLWVAQLCPDPWDLWSRNGSQRVWGEQAASLGMASSREKSHQDFWCRIRCFQSYRQFSDVFCETPDQDSVPPMTQSQHLSPPQGTGLCSELYHSPFIVNPQRKICHPPNCTFHRPHPSSSAVAFALGLLLTPSSHTPFTHPVPAAVFTHGLQKQDVQY